jgi:hypothetical protein
MDMSESPIGPAQNADFWVLKQFTKSSLTGIGLGICM